MREELATVVFRGNRSADRPQSHHSARSLHPLCCKTSSEDGRGRKARTKHGLLHATLSRGLSNLSITGILGRTVLCGGCLLHCRTVSSIHPLDAGGTTPAVTTTDVSGHCHMFPGGANHPQLRTPALNHILLLLELCM